MRVRIVDIQDKQGNTRKDGRYPFRIGCIASDFCECEMPLNEENISVLIIRYEQDNRGNPKSGLLHTSRIVARGYINDCYKYETINSIYYLKEIDQEAQ